jgi:hypothetical protein
VTGVLIAGCAALDAVFMDRTRARRSIAIACACVLAPLLTPLGWHYWPRVLAVIKLARELKIDEYSSAFELAWLPFWGCVVLFVALMVRSGPSPWQSRRTRLLAIVAAVFAVAGAMSVRNMPMFLLTAVPAMSRLWPTAATRRTPRPMPLGNVVLMTIVLAIAALGVAVAWRDRGAHLGWVPMSPAAIDAIRRCDGPLFNGFADGGALTWFVPERKVFVDSRGAEAYPLDLLKQSREADLHGRYHEVFRQFGIRCAVVAADSPMAHALREDREMDETYADSQWRVFSRTAR